MIAVLVGTRPELIKMAPVLRRLRSKKIEHIFIHSGQHYSIEMDQQIISDLNLGKPHYQLNTGSGSHATQTGKIMKRVEKICMKLKPKIMLVHGDTNTTLAGALTAKKLHIPVGHVEAGLRSFDYRMPEEVNRILTDRISDILFCPTEAARENLLKEGIDDKLIVVTGNTIVDALKEHLPLTKKSKILESLNLKKGGYILVTAHRTENIDDRGRLNKLIDLFDYASKLLKKPIIWPIHPRAEKSLKLWEVKISENITITSPVGYIDMLVLLNSACFVLTDSGGIQEEAYILKKPLITLRDSTERPETLSANFIVDLDKVKLKRAVSAFEKKKVDWIDDAFGDGTAGSIIVATLEMYLKGNIFFNFTKKAMLA